MSYFKHMVSYKHQDTAFGNSGGFTVVWWLFNWIAINTTKKKKRNWSLSAQSQVKYCNDFLLYIYIVPDTSKKYFFGDLYWRLLRKHQLQNASQVNSHNWFPHESTEKTSKSEVGKLLNEPKVHGKGASPSAPRDWGPGENRSSRFASTSVNRAESLVIPIIIITYRSTFLTHQMITLTCVVINLYGQKLHDRWMPQNPNHGFEGSRIILLCLWDMFPPGNPLLLSRGSTTH